MTLYFATVLPGLESVLSDEITSKVNDAEIKRTKRGKVFFTSSDTFDCLSSLRTADNLYQLIDRFTIGPHKIHLSQLEERISRSDLYFIDKDRSFQVNASRKGKQTYSRFEAAEAAMAGIAKRYPGWEIGTAKNHKTEFRLDIENDEVTFSLRLTDATFRYRNTQRRFSRAALRPTVAHGLIWLSDPQPEDVFVDPCCGSGTILSERIVYPARDVMGGDISNANIKVTKENVGHSHVRLHRWDARAMPVASHSVDKVVTNLPFGRQVSNSEDVHTLNGRIVKEISRIMKTNGKAVMLSDDGHQFPIQAEQLGLSCIKSYPLSLKGLHPVVYIFTKN